MSTSPVDLKATSTAHKLFLGVMTAKHYLMDLIIYGIAFICLMILLITANTLLNDRHLHLSVTVDDQEIVLVDLRKNH